MKRSSMKYSTPRAVAMAAVIAILTVGTLTVAFAADLGGIRQAATIWIQGKPREALVTSEPQDANTEVIIEDDSVGNGESAGEYIVNEVVDVDDGAANGTDGGGFTVNDDAVGSYNVTWQDEDGVTHSFGGGGVTIDGDGTTRPITAEEWIEYLNEPSVDENAEGRLIAAWYDQAVDITDRFEDGVCRVSLTHDGETVYMVVRLNGDGGYSFACGNEGFEALEADLEDGARLEANDAE